MTLAPLEPADSLDAELALSAARGDRVAFAAIYDRYADRLFDFCAGMLRDRDAAADCVQDAFVIAATKLDQLHDPQRLRAWLYAIARNEALARIRDRRRELPSDDLPETPSNDPDLASLAARTELADLIAEAFDGLSERDRTVYELAYRHGLDGPELAAALGVSHTNANTLVGRLRDGIERSLGALLVCRSVTVDPQSCPDLAAVLTEWDGTFTVLVRKRVARHIDGCEVCDGERRRRVSPAALLGGVPVVLPAPALLREQVLDESTPVLPAPDRSESASWWPATGFDTSDLDSANGPGPGSGGVRTQYLRAALIAALVVIGIAGVAQLNTPLRIRVEPVSETLDPTTRFTANSIAGTPRTAPPATPRTVSTSAQAPTDVPSFSRTAAPEATPSREPMGTDTPRTTTARTDIPRTTVNQSFEPSRQSTTTRTTTSETSTSSSTPTSTSTSSPTSTTTSRTSTSTSTTTSTTTPTSDPIE